MNAPLPSASAHEEAARYALLQRIAPTLRHHLAGEFQPLTMMAALLERRLQQRADPAGLQEQCGSIGQLSRQAAARSVALMNWIAPRAPAQVALGPAVQDCVQLLASGLRLRGFGLSSACQALMTRVNDRAVHSVLPAAIVYLSDEAPGPADLRIDAQVREAAVSLQLTLHALDRPAPPASPSNYRRIGWADVCALAQAESVSLERLPGRVNLELAAQGRSA